MAISTSVASSFSSWREAVKAQGRLECDYLIVGGGAMGMSFADSLLAHSRSSAKPKVIMLDKHAAPGGLWQDSYAFVRLHQPSAGYGVETERLELAGGSGTGEDSPAGRKRKSSSSPGGNGEEADATQAVGAGAASAHRATRPEILDYYARVAKKLSEQHGFQFIGPAEFVFGEGTAGPDPTAVHHFRDLDPSSGRPSSDLVPVRVAKKLVDARFIEPDLPISTSPKFRYREDSNLYEVLPVNALNSFSSASSGAGTAGGGGVADDLKNRTVVVVGAGKTGMDAVVHLQTVLQVPPERIAWVMPHEAWLTARESIGNCMEFLNACVKAMRRGSSFGPGSSEQERMRSVDFIHNGFLEWEKGGKLCRIDPEQGRRPTKFKDATVDREELHLLRQVVERGRPLFRRGRLRRIGSEEKDAGQSVFLEFEDGTTEEIALFPRGDPDSKDKVLFLHCSAGAFNFSKTPAARPEVFSSSERMITLQEIYGTPGGFCFSPSLIAWLEAKEGMSPAEKNALCLLPPPGAEQAEQPLGPSSGDIGPLSAGDPLAVRTRNLKKWYAHPGLGEWLHGGAGPGGTGAGHRLYNLNHLTLDEARRLADENWDALCKAGFLAAAL